MNEVKTSYEHVVLDENQVPIVADTTTKVVELVLDRMAYGWSPEELHFQHPHLSLGQIYSALAYYFDHQEELDSDIERRVQMAEEIRARLPAVPLIERLRGKGLV